MIQYSHLKDRGITTVYEASSFNYLANGQIKFEDSIVYLQRGDRADGNSSICRNTNVFFEGASSISDFCAKGFYPNSNVISSRKTVWSNAFYNSRNSSRYSIIHINTEVAMGPIRKRDAGYDLMYDAAIQDGVFSTLDTASFINNICINNIGIKSAYWEQNALLKGNITLKNNLYYGDLAHSAKNEIYA